MEEQKKKEKKSKPRCQDCALAYSGGTNWNLKKRAAQVTDRWGYLYPGG